MLKRRKNQEIISLLWYTREIIEPVVGCGQGKGRRKNEKQYAPNFKIFFLCVVLFRLFGF